MLRTDKHHAHEMIIHAREEDPNECCGILAGAEGVVYRSYRITNTTRSPYRYLMDPQEFLNAELDAERNGWDFLAFYHSHTHSPAYPSSTDVRMALQSGWLDIDYVLVSLDNQAGPEVRAFHIDDAGGIVEVELQFV